MERLNKFLAHAGAGSRRHCEELILRGRVKVDGAVVRELGTKVDPDKNQVAVDDQVLHHEKPAYWLVNKPRGYLCTNHDPAGRPLAIDLVTHVPQRVYTVGRLDEDSEGLLLLTNDGDLAYKLMHPRFGVEKTYHVQVAGNPSREDYDKLLQGVWLSDGHVKAQHVRKLKGQGDSTWVEIVLSEGKNREIRRMLARLGHKVLRLKRIAIGPLLLDRLPKGKSRKVHADELERLRTLVEHVPGPGEDEDAEEVTDVDVKPQVTAPQTPRPRPAGARPGPRLGKPPRGQAGRGPIPSRPADRRKRMTRHKSPHKSPGGKPQ